MKIIIFSLTLLFSTITFSQIGVGTNTIHSSAILELQSTDKGFLMPRVANHTSITTPVAGMQVFDITSNSVWFHNGTSWINLGPGRFKNGDISTNAVYTAGNVGVGKSNPTSNSFKTSGLNSDNKTVEGEKEPE